MESGVGLRGRNQLSLMSIGLIDAPLEFLLYSQTAVIITLTHAWAAFAILPMYVSLEKSTSHCWRPQPTLGMAR